MKQDKKILVVEVVYKLLIWWLVTALVIGFALFVMTIQGKFRDIEGVVWFWYGIGMSPCLALFALRESAHDILIPKTHFRIVFYLTGFYLVFLFTIVASSQAAIQFNEFGLDTWYRWAINWTVLFALLVLGVNVKFLRFNGKGEGLSAMIKSQSDEARQKGFTKREGFLKKIGSGNLEKDLFDQMRAVFEKSYRNDLVDELLVIQGNYNESNTFFFSGLVPFSDYHLITAKTRHALSYLINHIEE